MVKGRKNYDRTVNRAKIELRFYRKAEITILISDLSPPFRRVRISKITHHETGAKAILI